jgi:hypothetical protein
VTWMCTPGARACDGLTRVNVCDPNGLTATPTACRAGESCRMGQCMTHACTPNASSCADTSNRRVCDADGLGSTLVPCLTGQRCDAGVCRTVVCTAGTTRCLNPQTVESCASDGLTATSAPCPSGQSCTSGSCRPWDCMPGSASCASPNTRRVCNPDGFGTMDVACGSGEVCSFGTCRVQVCTPNLARCLSPQTLERCAPDGFSAATTTCPSSTSCAAGTCAPWVCTPNAVSCASTVGVRLVCSSDGLSTTDAPCPVPSNASAATCAAGACGFVCAAGFGDCDGSASNGCEVTVTNSPQHCGACGRPCAARANATASCANSACEYRCADGFADCDGNVSNGCEANLANDRANCGACGMTCPMVCRDRACVDTIHNSAPFTSTTLTGGGCSYADAHRYLYVNLGRLTFAACLTAASRVGGMLAPGQYTNPTTGWFGHRLGGVAMTGSWPTYQTAAVTSLQACVVGRDVRSTTRDAPLSQARTYEGQTWRYQDYGPRYYDECQLLASDAGASMITPYTIGLTGADYWVQTVHSCNTYVWITEGGTGFAHNDVSRGVRSSLRNCMVGYVDN